MKSIVSLALILGLAVTSCKKETTTTTIPNADTVPMADTAATTTTPAMHDSTKMSSPIDSISSKKDSIKKSR